MTVLVGPIHLCDRIRFDIARSVNEANKRMKTSERVAHAHGAPSAQLCVCRRHRQNVARRFYNLSGSSVQHTRSLERRYVNAKNT